MRKSAVVLLLGIALVLVGVCGTCEKVEYCYPRGTIKVGVAGPMTGVLSQEGTEFVHGATLAMEELNAQGGIMGYKVEIVVGDTGSEFEPGTVTNVFEKLILNDKVDLIVSGYTSQEQFEADICREYGMIYITAGEASKTEATVSAAPDEWPTFFNLQVSYQPYRTELPKRMEKWFGEGRIGLPSRKWALVTSDNAYSRWISEGLRKNFAAIGWELVLDEMMAFGPITEWGPIMAKLRANPPALVVNTDYVPANAATFLEQFLENPTNTHVFLQYAPTTSEFLELLGDKADGTLFNTPGLSPWIPTYKQGVALLKKYVDRWGYDPGMYGPICYSAVMIWAEACRRYGDPKDHLGVAKSMLDDTVYWGFIGLTVFNPETHLADSKYAPAAFYQIWEQVRNCIDPDDYATTQIKNPPWWKD